MLRSESERGEGRLGSIIWLLIVAGVLYASWNLIPVYYSNYNFADKATELARAPKYSHPDDRIESERSRPRRRTISSSTSSRAPARSTPSRSGA